MTPRWHVIWGNQLKRGSAVNKILCLAVSSLVVAFATHAGAADVSLPTFKAPAPTVYSWTGCYVGAHGGAGGLYENWSGEPGIGGLAGGQLGCNYQMGMLVLGIEGEGFWSGMKDTGSYTYFDSPTDYGSGATTVKNTWDADIAARFGLAIDRALIYGKAGVAWGAFNFASNNQYCCTSTYTYNAASTLTGLIIGIGLEYGITANWTAKFEYDYLDFPAKNIYAPEIYNGVTEPGTASYGGFAQIFKLGVNYKFY
jgi:outer membrane immunogenic protein